MTWYLASCYQCDSQVPFRDRQERDAWAEVHGQVTDPFTGEVHTVVRLNVLTDASGSDSTSASTSV